VQSSTVVNQTKGLRANMCKPSLVQKDLILVGVFLEREKHIWVVVSNIFYFHTYLGKISNLTNMFQTG